MVPTMTLLHRIISPVHRPARTIHDPMKPSIHSRSRGRGRITGRIRRKLSGEGPMISNEC